MAMKRMMRMNILNSGKQSQGGERGRDNEGRNERRYGRDGMERDDWRETGRMGHGTDGRYSTRPEWKGSMHDEYDDEMERGGGYAGRFRHREDSGEHEAGKEVKFDEHKAKEWVQKMQNGDGTTGEHFRSEVADQLRATMCPSCDKTEFWAALNMMYSDYYEVAKKLNIDRPEFYGHMAKAFLMDKDAGEEKLAKYMKYIAGK